jgi:hypothetical protein
MQHYHDFQLDWNDQVVGKHELICGDDEDARQQAARLVDSYDIELWQGERKVALFRSEQNPKGKI